jgi:hypothetical protein
MKTFGENALVFRCRIGESLSIIGRILHNPIELCDGGWYLRAVSWASATREKTVYQTLFRIESR